MAHSVFQVSLGFLLQRLPILTHLLLIPFAILGPTYLPRLFATALITIHLAVWNVAFRSVYGTWSAWRGVRKLAYDSPCVAHKSLSLSSTSNPLDTTEHLILIPNYKEDISTLRETLHLLSTHPRALTAYHPVLAMEAGEDGATKKAKVLIEEFRSRFKGLGWTLHPQGIEGEMRGKGSNLAWASKMAWKELMLSNENERASRTIVTVIDSDTALAADYFDTISSKSALASEAERRRMTFTPTLLFDRNAHDVPVLVRLTDILWTISGMASIHPHSAIRIPTSAYSLSMTLLAQVGFHDAVPEAIGEDLHTYIKCLFATRGNFISHTVYSPASSLNVVASEGRGLGGYWRGNVARYSQALRHLWGSLDSGYTIGRCINKNIPTHYNEGQEYFEAVPPSVSVYGTSQVTRQGVTGTPFNELYSVSSSCFSTETLVDNPSDLSHNRALSRMDDQSEKDSKLLFLHDNSIESPLRILPFLSLFARLYEGHFLMIHTILFVALRFTTQYRSLQTLLPVLTPPLASKSIFSDTESLVTWAYLVTDWMRLVVGMLTVISLAFYDRYHQWSALYRWQIAGERLGEQSRDRSYRRFPLSMLDWIALPAVFIFGIIPMIHAQFMHLFTVRLDYDVSAKSVGMHATQNDQDSEKGFMMIERDI